MTETDPTPAELQKRITGLTQAVAAITAHLITQGVADENGIMDALHRCEIDLRRAASPTFESAQVGYLREEVRQCLPRKREPFED